MRLLLPLLLLAAACQNDPVKCAGPADCLQGGIPGICLPAPSGADSYCAFPDGSCIGSGHRWGVLSGDLSAECVEGDVPLPDAGPSSADADADGAPKADAGVLTVDTWSPAEPLAGMFNEATAAELDPALSPNGLELAFASQRSGSQGLDIYIAKRDTLDADFGPAVRIESISTPAPELGPEFSHDGKFLYFHRLGEGALFGILFTRRVGETWDGAMPTNLKGTYPSVSADDQELFYQPTNCMPACLARAKRLQGDLPSWDTAVEPIVLPGGLEYGQVDISPNGLELLLSDPGTPGAAKVLVATRPAIGATFDQLYNIPTLSFITSYGGASWGPAGDEIYLTITRNPATGVKDILRSVRK